jgi:hypothetical protein
MDRQPPFMYSYGNFRPALTGRSNFTKRFGFEEDGKMKLARIAGIILALMLALSAFGSAGAQDTTIIIG